MDIGVVSSGHIPSQWAHSIAVAKNANGFHQLGHEVTLLSVDRWSESRTDIDDVTAYYGISDDIDVVRVTDRTPFYFQDVYPLNYLFDAADYATRGLIRRPLDPERRISRLCEDADVCYCRSYRTVSYTVELGIPTIMESHSPVIRKPALKRAIELSDREAFRTLVTISDRLAENFVSAGVPREKILVLQDGVDLEQFSDLPDTETARDLLDLPTDSDIVLYCGSLHEDKGIRHILEVATRLPDVRFQLVGGDQPEIDRWRTVSNQLGCENVHFTGYVENNTVPTYLRAADVLFMPYKTDHEVSLMDLESTSPLKLFEYMAAERPIVSTDIPAISRTIEHGTEGLLAAPNDIEELTTYVTRALEDATLASRLASNARTAVREYAWSNRCERMLEHAGVA